MSYKGFGPFTLTGGNFKEPFSFDTLTSNNNTLFMERSLASAFTPNAGRNTAFAVGTHGENSTLAGGVFGGNINVSVPKGGTAAIDPRHLRSDPDIGRGPPFRRVWQLSLAGPARAPCLVRHDAGKPPVLDLARRHRHDRRCGRDRPPRVRTRLGKWPIPHAGRIYREPGRARGESRMSPSRAGTYREPG